jgi:glycosyltransferase involved in cell wall biosynthesis
VNISFVCHNDFRSNSGIHVFNLANELDRLGHSCAVFVPDGKETAFDLGNPRFAAFDFSEARGGSLSFPDGSGPAFVHAWTPREHVRLLAEQLAGRYQSSIVVHLEDNEDVVTSDLLGIPLERLMALPDEELDRVSHPHLSHPRRSRAFLEQGVGITVIIDRLREFAPDGVPTKVVWPAFEDDLFHPQPADPGLRAELGLRESDAIIVYPGNVHASNVREMRSLYLAIALLNRKGRPVRLVRLGEDHVDLLGDELRSAEQYVVHAGSRPHRDVPRYLALADVLVQPGRPDAFNDYRFPSKLPEFLAMGKPLILPRSNIGRYLTDGDDALLLERGDALEIAQQVERVLDDPSLATRLEEGARRFAESKFGWDVSAARLAGFYEQLAARSSTRAPRRRASPILRRYEAFGPAELGYATVRDYCDSVEHLPTLATANQDMKDVQRPWVAKAIVGSVPHGGTLLEIGAGEPLVASLLAELGYDVCVVDPYDGRDGGPNAYDAIRVQHPRVNFVRGLFPAALTEAGRGPFDCTYSISVLEHLPIESVSAVVEGLRAFTKPGGATIHAIDHVHLGAGHEAHLIRLARIVEGLGLPVEELDAMLERLDQDPDAYFLSAESHNRWRGQLAYDKFPMRRCISVQLCLPVVGTPG